MSCCFQAPQQRCWSFRSPILRLSVIFFRFYSFIQTTNQKSGNASDAYWKKGGWLVCCIEFHNNNSNSIIEYHPLNRPFLSYPRPLYQNKVRCSAFDKEMIFHSHANKTHFHIGLILKVRVFGTRKWSIERSRYGL